MAAYVKVVNTLFDNADELIKTVRGRDEPEWWKRLMGHAVFIAHIREQYDAGCALDATWLETHANHGIRLNAVLVYHGLSPADAAKFRSFCTEVRGDIAHVFTTASMEELLSASSVVCHSSYPSPQFQYQEVSFRLSPERRARFASACDGNHVAFFLSLFDEDSLRSGLSRARYSSATPSIYDF